MNDVGEKVMGIIGAIIGLSVLAIVISSKANTASVLSSFFGGLSNLIGVAISPVTGQTVSNLSAGLSGGSWSGSSSTSGFSLNSSYGVNVGGLGQITNLAGNFTGGLLSGVMGGAYGYSGNSGGTNFSSLLGGGSGSSGGGFIDTTSTF